MQDSLHLLTVLSYLYNVFHDYSEGDDGLISQVGIGDYIIWYIKAVREYPRIILSDIFLGVSTDHHMLLCTCRMGPCPWHCFPSHFRRFVAAHDGCGHVVIPSTFGRSHPHGSKGEWLCFCRVMSAHSAVSAMHWPLLVSFSQKLVACESRICRPLLYIICHMVSYGTTAQYGASRDKYTLYKWQSLVVSRPQPGEIQAMEQIVRDVMAMEQREVPLGGWTMLNHSVCLLKTFPSPWNSRLWRWNAPSSLAYLSYVGLCMALSLFGFDCIDLTSLDASGIALGRKWMWRIGCTRPGTRWKQFDPCIRQS